MESIMVPWIDRSGDLRTRTGLFAKYGQLGFRAVPLRTGLQVMRRRENAENGRTQ